MKGFNRICRTSNSTRREYGPEDNASGSVSFHLAQTTQLPKHSRSAWKLLPSSVGSSPDCRPTMGRECQRTMRRVRCRWVCSIGTPHRRQKDQFWTQTKCCAHYIRRGRIERHQCSRWLVRREHSSGQSRRHAIQEGVRSKKCNATGASHAHGGKNGSLQQNGEGDHLGPGELS